MSRSKSVPTRNPLPVVFAAVLTAAFVMIGLAAGPAFREPPATPAPAVAEAPKTVQLTIDYHDGVEKVFTALPFKAGMTVLDVLKLAQEHPRGIRFESSGSGATTFIKQVDDLKNQGGGRDSLNWQFLINGKLGKRGAGAVTLEPGDRVRWEFDVYKFSAADPK